LHLLVKNIFIFYSTFVLKSIFKKIERFFKKGLMNIIQHLQHNNVK